MYLVIEKNQLRVMRSGEKVRKKGRLKEIKGK
jgi:hypothetical protein